MCHDSGPNWSAFGIQKHGAVVEATNAYRYHAGRIDACLSQGYPDSLATAVPPCSRVLFRRSRWTGYVLALCSTETQEHPMQVKDTGLKTASSQVNS